MRHILACSLAALACAACSVTTPLDEFGSGTGGIDGATSSTTAASGASSAGGAGGTMQNGPSTSTGPSASSSTGPGGDPGTGGSGGAPSTPCVDPFACEQCLKAGCFTEFTDCLASSCTSILACGWTCACGDTACWTSCYGLHPLGQAAYDPLAICALTTTCSECAPKL